MEFITDNVGIVIALIIVLLIAIVNGLRTGKLQKFLIAALNVIALLFFILGIFNWVKNKYFSTNDKVLDSEVAATKKYLSPDFLSTSSLKEGNPTFFNTANIYLDFSGSVKPKALLERIAALTQTLAQIPDKNFYYFGTCIGPLENPESLNLELIENYQETICKNQGKLKAHTDIVGLLNTVNEELEHSADDRTLYLFITDDEQSTSGKKMNIANEIQSIKLNLQKFQEAGVTFQLIKIRGNVSNKIMSSDELSKVFIVDEVDSNLQTGQLKDIFKNRFIINDLKPIQIDKSSLSNNKILFNYSDFILVNGEADINLTIENMYNSFSPLITIDSVIGAGWKAFPKKTDIGIPYFEITSNEQQEKIRFNLVVNSSIQFYNQSRSEKIKTFYSILIPGSQQYNIRKILENQQYFKPQTADGIMKGLYKAEYYSNKENTIHYKTTPWIYLIYALIYFVFAKIISIRLRPTLKGRSLEILRTDVDNYRVIKKYTTNQRKDNIQNLNQLHAFTVEVKKVRRSKFNILHQPFDNIHFTSVFFLIKNEKGKHVNSVLVRGRWEIRENSHHIVIK